MITLFETLFGGAVTLLFTYIGWRIMRTKYSLVYYMTESGLFPTDNGHGKYYTIQISNDGNKEIKNIVASILISEAKINRVTNHAFITDVQKTDDMVELHIPLLNKNDSLNFVITIDNAIQSSKPTVVIRGEGATASFKTQSQGKFNVLTFILTLEFGLVLGLITPEIIDSVYSTGPSTSFIENKAILEAKKGKPDKIETIFSILNHAKLSHLFPEIIKTNDNISYVGVAFYLTHSYLQDIQNKDKYLNALKGLAGLEDIAASSKGVIYYLIYKIDTKNNNVFEATQFLNKCKKETPLMYEHLISQDKYYNLDTLQNWLVKHNY